jgi:hypothetical protein
MANLDNRVLSRLGARELNLAEIELVSAGTVHTENCTVLTLATASHTGPGDGDACGDTDNS